MYNRNYSLCLSLAQAETELEVMELLEKQGYWNDEKSWRDYGDNENNFSTIGNQQSNADAALVEKIINSVDAVLLRECLERNIKPDSLDAPKNLQEALHKFFDIYDGRLTNLDSRLRTKLADNIQLVATGDKLNPSYTIIDKGEGQSPDNFPSTFLSLNGSNKLRIPFVQGKFNMGATGSLQFCGKQNLQLIVSKRDPKIAELESDDSSNKLWGFTLVRRVDPFSNIRSSTFKYLAPNNEVLKFEANSLPLLPGDYPNPYGNPFEWGTFVKMYNYQLKGLRTVITLDLYYKLSLLLPNIALPIMMLERRKGYTAHSYSSTMPGLSVRLEEDKRENVELGFPSSGEILAGGQKLKVLTYAFKKDQSEKYAPREGIIFTVNGQAHGFIPRIFFERKNVGMAYLKDSILVILDCTDFNGRTREDLFMNSRDRLREGELKEEIENQLEDLVRNHQGLKELRERRRRDEIENALQDSKPLAEIINNIIKNSPTLSQLFIHGSRIKNPFELLSTLSKTKYNGKRYPTFFKLDKEYPSDKPKICHVNKRFRIQFETDAENDYLDRYSDPGEFNLYINDKEIKDYSLNLWNGLASLNVGLPSNIKIGDSILFNSEIRDRSRVEPFLNRFYVKIIDPDFSTGGRIGTRRNPSGDDGEEKRKNPSLLALPNVIECRITDELYRFKEDPEGSLSVVDVGDGTYDFYINMDNVFLKTEQKGLYQEDNKILEARFKYGLVLIGLSILDAYHREKEKEDSDEKDSIYDRIYFFSKAISPVLLPMISDLGELEF